METTKKTTKKQPKTTDEMLRAKARRKFLTNSLATELVRIPGSPLNKGYALTHGCCRQIVVHRDQSITSPFYCKKRWCMTCAAIQMGTQINNYLQPISELEDLQLVTLTIRNIDEQYLNSCLDGMAKTFRKITDKARKQGRQLTGLRKLEVKVALDHIKYHPHYHLIVSGAENSQWLVDQWLGYYKTSAHRDAQDISPIEHNHQSIERALTEVLKYATKLTCAEGTDNISLCTPRQMDAIFNALNRRRIYQSFGALHLKPETDFEIQDEAVIKRAIGLYEWCGHDWYHVEYTSPLSYYHPEALELYNYTQAHK